MNQEIPDEQTGFRKGRGTRVQIANIHWIIKKPREFQKNIYFCFICQSLWLCGHQFSDFSLRLTPGCWGALHLVRGALLSSRAVTTGLQDPAQRRGVRAYQGRRPLSDSRSPLCSVHGPRKALCPVMCSMESLCSQNLICHFCHSSSAVEQRPWCVL